jgi:hypothetical protein
MTRDGMKSWTEVSYGLMGAKVNRLAASKERTFVLYADTDRGIVMTRDGGMSWRMAEAGDQPAFVTIDPHAWQRVGDVDLRIDERGQIVTMTLTGWRIPLASWIFKTPLGIIAGGPGGAYLTRNGTDWTEVKLWREEETGAADYLHAYWMGRYYGFYRE